MPGTPISINLITIISSIYFKYNYFLLLAFFKTLQVRLLIPFTHAITISPTQLLALESLKHLLLLPTVLRFSKVLIFQSSSSILLVNIDRIFPRNVGTRAPISISSEFLNVNFLGALQGPYFGLFKHFCFYYSLLHNSFLNADFSALQLFYLRLLSTHLTL